MGLRYEAWTLPWDTGGFKRKVTRLPIIEGSGQGSKPFLTTAGNGSGDISLADFDRLSDVISDTESSLIRVLNGTDIVDEWIAERVSYHHNDAGDKLANISGGSLLSMFDKYLIYAFDYPNSPTINKDWIWGIPEGGGLLKNGDFERSSLPNGGFEDGNADQWDGTEDDAIFEAGTQVAARSATDARTGDWYMIVNPGTTPAKSGARRTISGLVVGNTYTIVGYMNDPGATGDRYRAGVSEVESASHTNAYEEDDYFWAEVDNATQGNGASDGTWQQFTITFIASGDSVELVVIYEGAGVEQLFNLDDWSLLGDGAGLDPWEIDRHGTGTSINVMRHTTVQAHSGTGSMEMQVTDGPTTSVFSATLKGYGSVGARQPIRVELGKLLTGSVWVRHDGTGAGGANEMFRLTFRRATPSGPLRNSPTGWFPAPGSTYMASKTIIVPQDTWTQITLTHEADVTDLQFLVSYVGTTARTDVGTFSSPTYWVDDAVLFEGLVDTTIGDIGTQLFNDAAVDHEDDNRGKVLDWIDFTSFDDTTDSNSAAWDADIAFKASYGSTYGNFLDAMVDRNYEYELVPKATPAGGLTHDFHLYNPAGRDATPATAISAKQSVAGGEVVKRTPDFTAVLVNSPDGVWTEDEDATAVTNFGRLESFVSDSSSSIESRQHMADNWLAFEAANRAAVRFEVTESDDHPTPLVSYVPGDTIPMQLPPQLQKENRRVQRVDYTNTKPTRYGITGSRVLGGEAAAFDLVWRLWRRFQRVDETPSVLGFGNEGAGGPPTLLVAASNALESTKARADLVCSGVNDHTVMQAALDQVPTDTGISGRVVLSEGSFHPDWNKIQLPTGAWLQGMGLGATEIVMDTNPTTGTGPALWMVTGSGVGTKISDLSIRMPDNGLSTQMAIKISEGGCLVERVGIGDIQQAGVGFDGVGIEINAGGNSQIIGCSIFDAVGTPIDISATSALQTQIRDCYIRTDESSTAPCIDVNAAHVSITDCHLFPGADGILVTADHGMIANNSIRGGFSGTSGEHGIRLTGASDCQIVNNKIHEMGLATDNTYDGIFVEGDSDRNVIHGNKITPQVGTSLRYGINISASTCNDNLIGYNDYGVLADYGTSHLNDIGTDTLIAPSADEWNLGLPSGRTSNLAVVWDGNNFVLGAGGGGGGGSGIGAFTNVSSLSREGVLPTAPAIGVMEIPFMWAATIVQVRARVSVAPTGADIILDVNKNGTTMYGTATNPTIATGAKDSGNAVPDATTMAAGDFLSVDIDQIGSTIAGSNLVVVVEWEA